MKRALLISLGLLADFSILINSPCGGGSLSPELRVIFRGLPENTSDAVLLLWVIRLEDGRVSEVWENEPAPEMSIEAPSGPLTLWAAYFCPSADILLEGTASVSGDESVEVAMEELRSAPPAEGSSLPTYAPDEGMAIGYNPADFIVTGPDAEPWMGEAFAHLITTDLVRAPCAESGEAPYQVVESANPKGMAHIEAEIKLQSGPDLDPASRVTPHIIAATHLVKGIFSMGEGRIVVDLRVEDLEGEIIVQASATGSADTPIKTIEEAARSLADRLCGRKFAAGIFF